MRGCALASQHYLQKMNFEAHTLDHSREKQKCVKNKTKEPNLVLGEGVKLHVIKDLEEAVVVG
jgi:hypothetical protein